MLRELLDNKLKTLLVVVLVLLLAAVRGFEDVLFYDPFTLYFQGDYLNQPFPEFHSMHLFLSMGFRYLLNSALSLAIIQILFSEAKLTRFAGFLYLVFFVILIIAFFAILWFSDSGSNFLLFYTRRFLIQPVFLILFVPAFYYQNRMLKK